MATPESDNGRKAVLKPVDGLTGLFAFEDLERNPPEKKQYWFSFFKVSRESRSKKPQSDKSKKS